MTRDEIIRMAREAGFVFPEIQEDSFTCWWEELERFAALVAAHEREKRTDHSGDITNLVKAAVLAEREACAKVCEERADSYKYETDQWAHEHVSEANTCAAAIRVRNEK